MRSRCVILVALVFALGAAPPPATKDPVANQKLRAEVIAARAEERKIDAETIEKTKDPKYRAALKAEDAATREAERVKNTPGERYHENLAKARDALVAAKKKRADAAATVLKNDKTAKAAGTKVAALEKQLAAVAPDDEIAKAMLEHRLTPGMTLDEANEAAGVKGELVSEAAGGMKIYRWSILVPDDRPQIADPSTGKPIKSDQQVWKVLHRATFVGGTLRSWTRE